MRRNMPLAAVFGVVAAGCVERGSPKADPAGSPGDAADSGAPGAPPGPTLRLDWEAGLYAAPFPSDRRRKADGTVDLSRAPTREQAAIVGQVHALLDGEETGFSRTGGVFFPFDRPLSSAGLPTLAETKEPGAAVALVVVDEGHEADGQMIPVHVQVEADGGPLGGQNLLSLVPLQGVVLPEDARMVALATRALLGEDGRALSPAPDLAEHAEVVEVLGERGWPAEELAALTVFTTAAPAAQVAAWMARVRGTGLETAEALELVEVFDAFCVYEGVLDIPVYQSGTPPYASAGGDIDLAGDAPLATQAGRVWWTVPRQPLPEEAPAVVFVRTGGGGDRPLIDRGIRTVPGVDEPAGRGLAMELAQQGLVGVSWDGPLGGLRNVTGGDEQFLVFNVQNPGALRGNLLQSALELVLLPDWLAAQRLDTGDCPGASAELALDADALGLFGHSMGATIAPVGAANAEAYGALVLSGAGASWIENVVYKELPVPVRAVSEAMLDYAAADHSLDRHDPFLSLLQWAGELGDPPIHTAAVVARGTHVLMQQGIVDHYILPPIANGASLALRLDLAGPALDAAHAELQAHAPAAEVLPLVGRGSVALPASGNREGVTALVLQVAQDEVEDGHEVGFQVQAARDRTAAFFAAHAAGETPVVEE